MNNSLANQNMNLLDLVKDEDTVLTNPTSHPIDIDMNEIQRKRKEILRQKLRNKTNNLKNRRCGKEAMENLQLNALKDNEMFKNIQGKEDEVKKMIENMASSMSNDPKQKKNVKKQMEKLVDKLKETKIVI